MSFPENPPPVADIEWLRELAQEYRDNPQLDREYVFSSALLGFYDSMWEGLNKTTGNVVYRLSDYIPKKERERMLIYPNSNGSLVSNGNPWDSLEDWRRQW